MAKEVVLPELAESVVEGEIVKWLVQEGEQVAEDQPLVEVMTDKVTVELPSPFAGVLVKQLVKEGDVVPVHQAIALIGEGGAAKEAPSKDDKEEANEEPNAQAAEERSIVEAGAADEDDDGDSLSLFKASKDDDTTPVFQLKRSGKGAPAKATGPYGRVLAVPAARKLAREKGIDIAEVPGSGPNGRIRVEDVEAYLKGAPAAKAPPAAAPRIGYQTPKGYEERETRTPLRGLRRAISNQMLASHLQTVRTLHVDEADVTELVALRVRLKPLAEKRGVKLSYLPFIIKALIAALKAYPMMNASLDEEAGEVVTKHYYNIGMAVATETGLVVPVIREADRKSVLELAQEIERLAAKAREGKLSSDDVKGGTFSITNIGTLGGLFSFPIINVPEAAILGVHSIKKRPVVLDDDRIVARQMLYLSTSFDHRLIDGAEAAMFTSFLIELLETPESLMLES